MDDEALSSDARGRARRSGNKLAAEHAAGDPFAAAVRGTRMPMIVTDPNEPDNPIIFANRAFSELTGYSLDDVIGRNCRFLQGPGTSAADVRHLREGIAARRNTYVEILNYRRDGTPFWNALYVSPVEDERGHVVYFFGSQIDVTDKKDGENRLKRSHADLTERTSELEAEVARRTQALEKALETQTRLVAELDHRVKNNLQLMLSLVNVTLRQEPGDEAAEALREVRHRLQALGTAHRRLYDDGEAGSLDLGTFAGDLVHEIALESGRPDIKPSFHCDPCRIPSSQAAPLALVLSDLVRGALRHAYQGRSGWLRVTLREEAGRLVLAIADDHFSMAEKEAVRGHAGGTVVHLLARQLGAEIDWCLGDPQTLVRVWLSATGGRHGA